MKSEHQQVEWKERWKDDYLKWLCAFANAEGGSLFVGINDKGVVTGISDAKKLLADIPNKAKDILGIIPKVALRKKGKAEYLEIAVEAYPYPVSYQGRYFIRSGSTLQELKAAALDKFILKKQGLRWDAVPILNLPLNQLSKAAFDYFRKNALYAKRITSDDAKVRQDVLLDKLLLKADTKYFKRATALLFHPKPEKFVTGAFVKIGYFHTDDELAFQDEIHGNLFEQAEKTIDFLLTKYLKATISYNGLHRVETYPIPEPALREALLNALVHKDYSSGVPVQISVYENKIIIWNTGQLPDNWTVARLKTKHPSLPFNPAIANVFFRAGMIESWGRGTIKIIEECKKVNLPAPDFEANTTELTVTFKIKSTAKKQDTIAVQLTGSTADKVLHLIEQNAIITITEMANHIAVSERTIKRILKALQQKNIVKRDGDNRIGKWIMVNL